MKDFAKILEEALMERNVTLKKQKELAEEIVESALKQFSNIDVRKVIISYNELEEIVVDPGISRIGTKYSELCYGEVVYDNISEILFSNEDAFKALGMTQEKCRITLELKEDAWVMWEVVPPFYYAENRNIQDLEKPNKIFIKFIKKYWQNEK